MARITRFVAKLLWSSYETWALFWAAAMVALNGAISGGVAVLLTSFAEWPLWQQIAVSAGVALVWLTVVNRIVGLFERDTSGSNPVLSLSADHESVISAEGSNAASNGSVAQTLTGSSVGGDAVGRDKITNNQFSLDLASKYSARALLERVISEAKDNIERKGRSRSHCESSFVDAAYLSGRYAKWPESAQAATTDYRQRLQVGILNNKRYFEKYFIPSATAVIDELQAMLDPGYGVPQLRIIG